MCVGRNNKVIAIVLQSQSVQKYRATWTLNRASMLKLVQCFVDNSRRQILHLIDLSTIKILIEVVSPKPTIDLEPFVMSYRIFLDMVLLLVTKTMP